MSQGVCGKTDMGKRPSSDSEGENRAMVMVDETLCKILCHNLVVLIHEMCELGIDPEFWPNDATV
jgi:hypothetical protein